MQHSDQINEIASALSNAQGQMESAKKGTVNTFFKSRYADLASCIDAIRAPFAANGLAIVQSTEPRENGVIVITTMVHSSGQWFRSSLFMEPEKPGPQALGTVITYARRYELCAICGLSQEDDDAEDATSHAAAEAPKRNETKISEIRLLLTAAAKSGHESMSVAWQKIPQRDRTMFAAAEADWLKELGAKAKEVADVGTA